MDAHLSGHLNHSFYLVIFLSEKTLYIGGLARAFRVMKIIGTKVRRMRRRPL